MQGGSVNGSRASVYLAASAAGNKLPPLIVTLQSLVDPRPRRFSTPLLVPPQLSTRCKMQRGGDVGLD
ncbi:hypothetical protein DVH05_027863 [Phytophthora capsici]|nr:hypothetical protein DVH05_027863 [Phytophthora capsici]